MQWYENNIMLIQKEFHFGSSLARSCQKLLSKVVPSSNQMTKERYQETINFCLKQFAFLENANFCSIVHTMYLENSFEGHKKTIPNTKQLSMDDLDYFQA